MDVLIVNAYIKEEHEDNRRFLAGCEKWFGMKVRVLKDEKYGASTLEVWKRKRYIKGQHGAPCSLELKRKLLAQIKQPGDVNVIGFTRGEEDRLEDLKRHFPEENFAAPCIELGLSHEDCLAIIERADIRLPMMYMLGYQNANCIGCPKGGQAYWQQIRQDFPEQFIQIQTIQEDIGPGAHFLRFRSGPRKGERMSLADLPPVSGTIMKQTENFNCSFFCDMAGL